MGDRHWHVLGAGAIGCLFAARLNKGGHAVTLLLREPPPDPELDLTLEDANGVHHLQIAAQAVADGDDIDLLLVTTKAYDVAAAVAAVAHRLNARSQVILLANGLGFHQEVRARHPQLDLYSGTTTEGAYRLSPTHIRHAGRGFTRLGQAGCPRPTDWFHAWAGAIPESAWEEDIEQALWLKLAVNCAINPLTALHACHNGRLLEDSRLTADLQLLCQEIKQVSRAMGRVVGDLEQVALQVVRDTAENRSSMLQDLQAGRRTEIDYITGHLVRIAADHGVPTPFNAEILQRVKQLESQS
jgi:2-dehydropantoate 2-reductase